MHFIKLLALGKIFARSRNFAFERSYLCADAVARICSDKNMLNYPLQISILMTLPYGGMLLKRFSLSTMPAISIAEARIPP